MSARISEVIGVTTGTVEDLANGIIAAAKSALQGLIPYIVGFIVILVIGLFAGFYVTKYFVKRNSIKHKKFILWSLLESLVFLVLFSIGTWLVSIWRYSFYISIIVSIVVFGFITLTEAYVAQPQKTIGFKQIVNVKNSFSLVLSYLILLVICGALLSVIYAVSNLLIALSLGYALICIVFSVMSLTGRLYVEDLAEKQARGELKAKMKAERAEKKLKAKSEGEQPETQE